jgi:uncharacterized protein (DUF1697 family)
VQRQVFVVLFRGINVGGRRVVRMDALRKALADAGFGDVQTFIQSGNVVLTADRPARVVATTVEKAFEEAFGFPSRPTVRSRAEWKRLIADNPFPEAATDGKRLHTALLDGAPAKDAIPALEALAATERIRLAKGVLYLHTPDGLGRSKLAAAMDRILRVPVTVRNWNTVLKLDELTERVSGTPDG